jgi:hypothetical protein
LLTGALAIGTNAGEQLDPVEDLDASELARDLCEDLYATTDGLDFFRAQRDQAAAADVEPPTKEEQLYEALSHYGFPRLRVQRAIKALGDRVATESLSDLTRAALAILARRRPGSPPPDEPPPESGEG